MPGSSGRLCAVFVLWFSLMPLFVSWVGPGAGMAALTVFEPLWVRVSGKGLVGWFAGTVSFRERP